MKMKKSLVILTALVMSIALVGCKPSAEKISEAEGLRTQLQEKRTAAEEKYLDLADASLRPELDALGVRAQAFEGMDFSRLSNKDINEKIPELEVLLGDYDEIQQKLDGEYQVEAQANEELAKNMQIDAYVINKTGMDISSIILHDKTTDSYSGNLVGDGELLQNGYTLMGIKLEVNADSTEWEFLVKDSVDTQRVFSCESLNNASKDGVSLVFEYDADTDTGSVIQGGYFSN